MIEAICLVQFGCSRALLNYHLHPLIIFPLIHYYLVLWVFDKCLIIYLNMLYNLAFILYLWFSYFHNSYLCPIIFLVFCCKWCLMQYFVHICLPFDYLFFFTFKLTQIGMFFFSFFFLCGVFLSRQHALPLGAHSFFICFWTM